MINPTLPTVSALEVLRYLEGLREERALAASTPLAHDPRYTADLDSEIDATRHHFIGLAVTEMATLRAELGGPLAG